MLPSLEYIKTLTNGVIAYIKNTDKKIRKDVDTEIKTNAPDWEQNDPEGKGFIKNRPFYKKTTESKRVFTNFYGGNINPPLGLIKGETYLFGPSEEPTQTYICKDAHDENSSYPVGSLYVGKSLSAAYVFFDSELYVNAGWSHLVGSSIWAISGPFATFNTLDNKYISDEYRAIITKCTNVTDRLVDGSGSHSIKLDFNAAKATGTYSVSFGGEANGTNSLSAGTALVAANGRGSVAFGCTTANSDYMFTTGLYNYTTEGLMVIGKGPGQSYKKDAFTLDASGNGWFSGEVYIGSTGGITKDSGSKKLATEDSIPTKVSAFENDSGYLTEHQSLEPYAKKTEIPTVPTKVSAFENDSGYLTEHQSLDAYAKKTEIPNAVTYTEQTLTDDQKAQARNNIGAQGIEVASAYYMWVNTSPHTNDIYSVYNTGASIGTISGQCTPDSDGNSIKTPVTVIFGSVSRGYVDVLAISAEGTMYSSTLKLSSESQPILHKIKNLTLNDDNTLSQQVMSAAPTEDMHIATKEYIDTSLNNFASAVLEFFAKKTEIPTVPTTDSELSATSTNPVQNKIVKAELDKKLESIPVDGTTIKLNDQGQLTLALSNANGVNF